MFSNGASEPLTLGSKTEYESYTCSEQHKVRPHLRHWSNYWLRLMLDEAFTPSAG